MGHKEKEVPEAIKAIVENNEILCDCCNLAKEIEEFSDFHARDDPMDPSPMVCDHCAKFGPPLQDPCLALSVPWRNALLRMASGGSIRDAARAGGMNEKTLRSTLNGTENWAVRASMNKLLINAGLGPEKIIQVLGDAADATRPTWHPEEKEFKDFPDHPTRLRAITPMLKLAAMEAPAERAADEGSARVQIAVVTNLGSKEPIQIEGQYEVRGRDG